MKYERLTERRSNLVIDKCGNCENVRNPQGCTEHRCYEVMKNRLAELEDKIERGELVDVKEYHIIPISRCSGKSFKRLEAIEILTKYKNGTLIDLPCKVGDTVYYHKVELNEFCPAKVIGIYINYYTPSMPIWITIEYESTLIGRQEERMSSEVFGMLCKKTKAEAEQKLKEMHND